jgi:hypothetical protein
MFSLAAIAEKGKRIQAAAMEKYQADFEKNQAAFEKQQAAFEKDVAAYEKEAVAFGKDQATMLEKHQAITKKLQVDLDRNQRHLAEMSNTVGKHGQTSQNEPSVQGSTQHTTATHDNPVTNNDTATHNTVTHNAHYNPFDTLFGYFDALFDLIDEDGREMYRMLAYLDSDILIEDTVAAVTDMVWEAPDVQYGRDIMIRLLLGWQRRLTSFCRRARKTSRISRTSKVRWTSRAKRMSRISQTSSTRRMSRT